MSTKHIDISVVTPVYGVEKYIKNSLHSLFSQTKTEGVEFILVNDCTPDRSIEIAKEVIACYPMLDIKIVEHKKNGGVAAARQTGLEVAQGEYILNIDSDDWCDSTMLEDMHNAAIQSKADVVMCDYYLSKAGTDRYISQAVKEDASSIIQDIVWLRIGSNIWRMLFKRSLFTNNNISFSKGVNYGEDVLITLKLLLHVNSVKYLPKAYLHYFQNEDSMTNFIKEPYIKNLIDIMAELQQVYQSVGRYQEIEEGLMLYKNTIRRDALFSIRDNKQREYAKMFPEARGKIMQMNNMPTYRRFIMLLAAYGWLTPYNILRSYTIKRIEQK